jgi:excisionase family DNA binding protein
MPTRPRPAAPATSTLEELIRQAVREGVREALTELRDELAGVAPTTPAPAAFTVPDIAARYQLSKRAIYAAIERGDLAALRAGRSVRVRREDLDAWLTAGAGRDQRPA